MLDAGMTPESATTPDGQIVMGLLMLQGFEKSAKDWRSGTIFDPGEGKTYSSRLKRLEDGRLQVKGCIAFFCQTQVWTVVSDINNLLATAELTNTTLVNEESFYATR